MKATAIAVSMLLAAATANAAQGWTLDQCIEYAIENNIQVRQSDLNAQNNDVELNKAVSNRLPGVSVLKKDPGN